MPGVPVLQDAGDPPAAHPGSDLLPVTLLGQAQDLGHRQPGQIALILKPRLGVAGQVAQKGQGLGQAEKGMPDQVAEKEPFRVPLHQGLVHVENGGHPSHAIFLPGQEVPWRAQLFGVPK